MARPIFILLLRLAWEAEWFYGGFFSLRKPFPPSENWCWQAMMPSYAQATMTQWAEFFYEGQLVYNDANTTCGTYTHARARAHEIPACAHRHRHTQIHEIRACARAQTHRHTRTHDVLACMGRYTHTHTHTHTNTNAHLQVRHGRQRHYAVPIALGR